MRNRFGPIFVTGTIVLSWLPVVEQREHFHIEQRQHQEPSKITYENPASTATVITGTVGLFDNPGDRWNSQ
jgi:hypothetical protein